MKKRLILGDCLQEMKSIKDNFVDLVLADPPYGITACKWDSIIPLEPMWEQLKRIAKPKAAIVMTASQPFTTILISSNLDWFKYCWVWEKEAGTGLLNSKKQPLRNHEDIPVFYREQCEYNPQFLKGKAYVSKKGGETNCYGNSGNIFTDNPGRRYPKTILKFKRDKSKQHPTQKPVALMEYLIKTYSKKGQTVLDFCMGSETTGVACANLERNFIGIEKEEKYFKIAKERIERAVQKQSEGFFPGHVVRG